MKDATSERNTIFSQTSVPTNNMIYYNDSDIVVDIGGTEYIYSATINDGNWHSLIFKRNDTHLEVLVDDISKGNKAVTGSFYINYVPTLYDGTIDELVYFDKVTTESETSLLEGGYGGAFNLIFKDELTGDTINNVSLEVFSDSMSSEYAITDGTFFLNGFPEEITTIRYRSENYSERFYYVDFNTYSGLFNTTLYLLNESLTDEIEATVYDNSGFQVQEDVYVKYARFYPDENVYKTVGMIKTNAEGFGLIKAQKSTEFYKFFLYYPTLSDLKTTTSPSYIEKDEINFKIPLISIVTQDFNTVMGVTNDIVYSKSTNNFKYTFSNRAGSDIDTTFTLYKYVAGEKNEISSTNVIDDSGTILIYEVVQNDTEYVAEATISIDDKEYVVGQKTYTKQNVQRFNGMGIFILIILTLVFMMVGYWSLSIALILTPLPLILLSIMNIVAFDIRLAIVIEIIFIFIAIKVKY